MHNQDYGNIGGYITRGERVRKGPGPNTFVISRHLSNRLPSASLPEPFEAVAGHPGVMGGLLGIAMAEVILDPRL